MSIDHSHKTQLPPSPFIRQVGEMMKYGRLDVLDVGSCMGRNATHLARLGHKVIGMDIGLDELITANQEAQGDVSFVAADARHLPFRGMFDLVLMNEVLHFIPKDEHKIVMRGLTAITKPGGFHAVSGYIGDKPHALNSRELYEMYTKPGWEIIEYNEDLPSINPVADRVELTSLASIIAMRK